MIHLPVGDIRVIGTIVRQQQVSVCFLQQCMMSLYFKWLIIQWFIEEERREQHVWKWSRLLKEVVKLTHNLNESSCEVNFTRGDNGLKTRLPIWQSSNRSFSILYKFGKGSRWSQWTGSRARHHCTLDLRDRDRQPSSELNSVQMWSGWKL